MKIICPILSQFPNLKHQFFEADQAPNSERNIRAVQEMTGKNIPLVTLKQVHGTHVIRVTEPMENRISGDGLVTNTQGLALGIMTADCGPVLFFDPIANVIGACHAGWRGAKAGILQSTLKAMSELGAKNSQIYATLGPSIQQQNYEVGPEFPDLIGEPYDAYFYPSQKPRHHHFNLPLYIRNILLKERLAAVNDVGLNTFTENFWSRRKLLSQEKKTSDSQFSAKLPDNLSAIAIV
jgi:polyphenol oxidase